MKSISVAAENIPQVAPRKYPHRSRVSNGSKLLPLADGRSVTARRFKDLFEDICDDLGGFDLLSEGQKQLIRRAAMLSAEAERLEALAARDERPSRENWKEDLAHKFDVSPMESFATVSDACLTALASSAVRGLSTIWPLPSISIAMLAILANSRV